jgi:hypothetical protein
LAVGERFSGGKRGRSLREPGETHAFSTVYYTAENQKMQVRNFKKTTFFRKMRKSEQILQAVSANSGGFQAAYREDCVHADGIDCFYPDFLRFRMFSV